MGVVVITDSTADIPQELVQKNNIIVLPLTVIFGQKQYKDKVELSSEDFFEMLENSEELPKTSQVTPNAFFDRYKEEIEKGNEIISIHISSELSGTCQSAYIAKNELNSDKIHIIDSKSATLGLGMIVLKACEMIDKGFDIQNILNSIEEYKNKVKLLIVVDTLEYLKKGGRLSGTQVLMGNLLGIKPILTIKDGKVVLETKERGVKKASSRIIEFILSDINTSNLNKIGIAHARCKETALELMNSIKDKIPSVEFVFSEAGSVISTHVGPGAFGVVYEQNTI